MDQVINSNVALKPPMGWNSWDCFGVNVTEEEVKANATFMAKHLKKYGWEYIIVDLGWYAPEATKDNYKQPNIPFLIDDFGRLTPDPLRFPSSKNGAGFKPLADFVHGLGLKFGIHIMRGLPWIAYKQNTPILNSPYSAKEFGNPDDMCLWFKSMFGINCTHPGGQAYYDSLIELYEQWEVDYIKADDLGAWDGDGLFSNYRIDEVETLSRAIAKSNRPMVLSISPGAAYIGAASHLRRHAHMWRISADFWDDWSALEKQFERCHQWSSRIVPGHWPDADMLPLGKIGIRGEIGSPRQTNFSENEQYTLLTLWCIFRNPLMFGGHLPESDELSISLITNEEVLEVNQNSKNNRQLFRTATQIAWTADAVDNDSTYLALFNIGDFSQNIKVDLGTNTYLFRDLWRKTNLGVFENKFQFEVPSHGAALFKLDNTTK